MPRLLALGTAPQPAVRLCVARAKARGVDLPKGRRSFSLGRTGWPLPAGARWDLDEDYNWDWGADTVAAATANEAIPHVD